MELSARTLVAASLTACALIFTVVGSSGMISLYLDKYGATSFVRFWVDFAIYFNYPAGIFNDIFGIGSLYGGRISLQRLLTDFPVWYTWLKT